MTLYGHVCFELAWSRGYVDHNVATTFTAFNSKLKFEKARKHIYPPVGPLEPPSTPADIERGDKMGLESAAKLFTLVAKDFTKAGAKKLIPGSNIRSTMNAEAASHDGEDRHLSDDEGIDEELEFDENVLGSSGDVNAEAPQKANENDSLHTLTAATARKDMVDKIEEMARLEGEHVEEPGDPAAAELEPPRQVPRSQQAWDTSRLTNFEGMIKQVHDDLESAPSLYKFLITLFPFLIQCRREQGCLPKAGDCRGTDSSYLLHSCLVWGGVSQNVARPTISFPANIKLCELQMLNNTDI